MTLILQDGQMRPRAGRIRRLTARAIDLFLMGLASIVAGLIFFFFNVDWILSDMYWIKGAPEPEGPDSLEWASIVVTVTIYLAVLLYELVSVAAAGRTFGKAMLGVCVVSHIDGLDPLLGQALVRWLVPTIAGGVGGMAALMVSGNRVGDLPDRGLTALILGAALSWTVVHVSSLWDPDGRGWPDKAAGTAVISA